MKAIKIDPYAETITEVELPDNHDIDEIYRQLGHGCDTFSTIDLGNRQAMYIDDEGLLKLKVDESDLADGTITRFFILCDFSNTPVYLVAGCGLILGADRRGNSVSANVNLDGLKKSVRFISAKNSIEAGRIANELLGVAGVCTTVEELRALQKQQLALVAEANKLTNK